MKGILCGDLPGGDPVVTRLPGIAASSGLLFVVLLLVASVCLGELLGAFGDPDDVFEEHFSTPSARALDIVGGYLLTMAGISFAVFVATHSRREALGRGMADAIAYVLGLLFSALVVGAAACLMTVSLSIVYGEAFGDDRPFNAAYAIVPQIGCVLFVITAPLAAAGHILATAIASRGEAPRLLTALGIVCAFALLFSVLYLPLFALPLWVLIAAVYEDRSRRKALTRQMALTG
jgi:hypothetical protein